MMTWAEPMYSKPFFPQSSRMTLGVIPIEAAQVTIKYALMPDGKSDSSIKPVIDLAGADI